MLINTTKNIKRKLKIVLFILISFTTIATKAKGLTRENIEYYNSIFKISKEIKNINELKSKFDSINQQNIDSKYLNIIFIILSAKIESKKEDCINNKSTSLYKKALELANESDDKNLILFVNTYFGYYYYEYSDYYDALPYFIKASKILDDNPDTYFLNSSDVYKKNSYFFGSVDDNERSIKYLKKALFNTQKTTKEYAGVLNGIAQYYIKLKEFDKAKYYLNQTIKYAIKTDNKIRYAKALGDLALIEKEKGNCEKAIAHLKKDIKISEDLNEDRNSIYAKILLSKIYLDKQNYLQAKKTINEAKDLTNNKTHLNSFLYDIYDVLLKIAIINNNTHDELNYRRVLNELKIKLSHANGEEVLNKINWEIQKENIKYQLETEIIKNEKEQLKNNALIVILFLLSSSSISIFLLLKKRIKVQVYNYDNKVLKLQLQKLESEKKLNEKVNSLKTYKIYLSEKNSQINHLKEEINQIKSSKISYLEEKNGELEKLLQSHLMTDENWTNFKRIFKEEQSEYCIFLNENFPELTDSNLRIIFLYRMGLNNGQIAQILGVTIDAIKKAKQRLRKKYTEDYKLIFTKDFG